MESNIPFIANLELVSQMRFRFLETEKIICDRFKCARCMFERKISKGIIRSAAPLMQVKQQRVLGQQLWQGTKFCRMGEKFPSIHPSLHLSICTKGSEGKPEVGRENESHFVKRVYFINEYHIIVMISEYLPICDLDFKILPKFVEFQNYLVAFGHDLQAE